VSVLHGDFRLGNLMLRRHPPAATLAILDWEMAARGDPLADLGYCEAIYARWIRGERPYDRTFAPALEAGVPALLAAAEAARARA
jgi:aminoglycoside phosphotransferase (APT) family kinase protein